MLFSTFLASSAFFCSAAFLSASATVSSNFFLALVNSSICLLTSSAVAFSFFNTSLASAKTLSSSLEILAIFSLPTPLIDVSKESVSLFKSLLSAFAVGLAVATFGVAGVFCVVAEFSESVSTFLLPPDEVVVILSPSCPACGVGIFSALADIPPPKKISDATATLAAPK